MSNHDAMSMYTRKEILHRFLNNYRATVQALVEEKHDILNEAEAKIDQLKANYLQEKMDKL